MYCANHEHTERGIPFVYTPDVYWKMVVYQNVSEYLSLIFTHRTPVWDVFAGSVVLFDHPFEYPLIGCEPWFITIRRCFIDSGAWSLWEKCHPRLRPILAHHTVIKPGVPVCLHRSRAWSHWTYTSAIAISRTKMFNIFLHNSMLGATFLSAVKCSCALIDLE